MFPLNLNKRHDYFNQATGSQILRRIDIIKLGSIES